MIQIETLESFEARMTYAFNRWAGKRKSPSGMPYGWWGLESRYMIKQLVETGRWVIDDVPPRELRFPGCQPVLTAKTYALRKIG